MHASSGGSTFDHVLSCAGPNGEDVPPIFIDRAGAKVGLIEQHSRSSKASLNLVLEQVRMQHCIDQLEPVVPIWPC